MAKIDLSKYGITGTTEIVYNPSYEVLFEEETKPELEGFEKGQVSELGAVNVPEEFCQTENVCLQPTTVTSLDVWELLRSRFIWHLRKQQQPVPLQARS